MSSSLIEFLVTQPVLAVVRGLLESAEPRHLREFAQECSLSPAGTSDILRRLQAAGVLSEKRRGNRRYVSLLVPDAGREALQELFQAIEHAQLAKRAKRFEKGAVQKLAWMDEAYRFSHQVKGG